MSAPAAFPDRDTTATKLSSFGIADQAFVKLLMENPEQDENLLEGLYRHLGLAAEARLLNTLKLEKLGQWLGNAPRPASDAAHGGRPLQPASGLSGVQGWLDEIRRLGKSFSNGLTASVERPCRRRWLPLSLGLTRHAGRGD